MRCSVITAYYKQAEMTRAFIDNLKDKLTDDDELIVVNAGNKDKIECEGIKNYKRVDLKENKSFSNSMNSGVRESTGDYVIIIGNDGFPQEHDWIEKLITYQQERNSYITCPRPNKPKLEVYNTYLIEGDEYRMFPAICWLIPRKVWDEVGEFDERFLGGTYEDDDYCKRVGNVGGKIVVNKSVNLHHLLSQEVASFNVREMMARNKKLFNEKWRL